MKDSARGTCTISDVKYAIQNSSISALIAEYESALEKTNDPNEQEQLLINHAFAALSLEMTNIAISDMNKASILNKSLLKVNFIKGLAYLWNGDEESALYSWRVGVEHPGDIDFYTIMISLINDANFRAHVFHLKFSVIDVMDLIENWNKSFNFTESDTQNAFMELKANSLIYAIDHFSQIIQCDPKNYKAYKGRGIAYCLIGEWKKCIDDINESYKFVGSTMETNTIRAYAYLATNQLSKAIIDLNLYLMNYPNDYDVIIEYARLQMKRGLYNDALSNFMKVPQNKFEQNGFLSFAECLYNNGELNNAYKVIQMSNAINNFDFYYITFLILKDLNKIKEAEDNLMEALKISSNYKINKSIAEFFMEIGKIKDSLKYFNDALKIKDNDEELVYKYGNSLFLSKNIVESFNVISKIHNGISKYYFLFERFNSLNNSINDIQKCYEQPSKIIFPEIEQTNIINDMIKDAESLGIKCIPDTVIYHSNPNYIRTIGFIILRIIYLIRNNEKLSWYTIINEIKSMFKIIYKLIIPRKIEKTTYYIIRNNSSSPRFRFAKKLIFDKFRKKFSDDFESFEELYQSSQSNLRLKDKNFEISNGSFIELPSIKMKYKGIFGFDIYVKGPNRENNDKIIDEIFKEIHENQETKYELISKVMLLIWINQNFGFMSNEIGHAILHSFIIATQNVEIDKFINDNLYISQMIEPNLNELISIVTEKCKNQKQSQIKESSIYYWKQLPTVGEFINLLNFEV